MTGPDARATTHWHSLPVEAVLQSVQTTSDGVSEEEAAARLVEFGPNRIVPPTPVSALKILRDQLSGVVVVLLAAAAGISLALGDHVETAAIAAVLVINTTIGFTTEWRARRAMDALSQLDVSKASVVRDGRLRVVDADQLVPGDVIEIRAGHGVPADARLLSETDLRVTEAALTGESLPVSKQSADVLDESTALAERVNMVFKGTTVAAGLARAVVIATGASTEVGRIGTLVGAVEQERTPLERRLDALGKRLVWMALAVAALVALLGAVQGASLALVIETSIALAVAAVPEALPAVATIALAVGMWRMARRHALVRRLPAVETLGSATVVCTDKTRTLTSGEMTLVLVWAAGREWDLVGQADSVGDGLLAAVRGAARASRRQASDAGGALRDPVDAAILHAADRIGQNQHTSSSVDLIPFSSERKFMAAFYEEVDRSIVFAKGAPRKILEMSGKALTAEGEMALDGAGREALIAVNDSLAVRGLRVLAVASGIVTDRSETGLTGLTFLGFLGLADPPAAGVKETIAELRGAGLRTVMLTGDQRLTAEAVGRELGILGPHDRCVDGRELDRLTGADLDRAVGRSAAFSRVTPEHKLVIVKSLQAQGQIVAMLGDGINDAAALKKADVGVAMGVRGTDVAKDAAAIVLQDDRFETIAAAVEEGRIIFENIRKFVFYLFSCNVAEVLVLLLAGIAGLPLPLTPLQLLWLNMVTDTFPALALALEPGDPDIMRRPPRDPRGAILSGNFLASVGAFALVITAATLGAFLWGLLDTPERASTMAFMTLAIAQIGHLGNARSSGPVLRIERAVANPYALAGAGLALLLQGLTIAIQPLASILHVVPLRPLDWVVALTLASLPAVGGQAAKILSSGARR